MNMDCPSPQMHECVQRLTRIETKLDLIAANEDDKEERLRSLERSKWWLVGVVAVFVFFKELLPKLFKP